MVKFVTIIDLFSKLGQKSRSCILVCMKLFPQGERTHVNQNVSRFSRTKVMTNDIVCNHYLFSKVGLGNIFWYITCEISNFQNVQVCCRHTHMLA